MSWAAGDNGAVIPEHLGQLHAYEQLVVLLLAFGPLVLLAVTVRIARRRAEHEDR